MSGPVVDMIDRNPGRASMSRYPAIAPIPSPELHRMSESSESGSDANTRGSVTAGYTVPGTVRIIHTLFTLEIYILSHPRRACKALVLDTAHFFPHLAQR